MNKVVLASLVALSSTVGLAAQEPGVPAAKPASVPQPPAAAQQQPVVQAAAEPKPAEQQVVRTVKVAPGALSGRVLQSGTRTPVEAHALVLLDVAGTEVSTVETSADGTFATPQLAAGNYVLEVADGVRLDLAVAADATIKNLDIVLPQGTQSPRIQQPRRPQQPMLKSRPPAAPGGAATRPPVPAKSSLGGGGLSATSWGLIGTGAAAAVAVPIAVVASDDDDRETPVSASGARTRK